MQAMFNVCRWFLAAETSLALRYRAELTGVPDPAAGTEPLRWVHRWGQPRLEGNALPDPDGQPT